jgi:hypothetical protein
VSVRRIVFLTAAVLIALSPLYGILWPIGWAVAIVAFGVLVGP